MDTLEDTLEWNIQDPEPENTRPDEDGIAQSFWGVNHEEKYERGWSERIGRNTPALTSDTCVWYFEVDTTTQEADDQSTPIVSITQTIAI